MKTAPRTLNAGAAYELERDGNGDQDGGSESGRRSGYAEDHMSGVAAGRRGCCRDMVEV